MGNNISYIMRLRYKMLYTFLKENGILVNYVKNVAKSHDIPYENVKHALMRVVERHGLCNESCNNLFNFAPSSFYWSNSIEGREFWQKYFDKWHLFYDKNKEKYEIEEL